MLGLPQDFALLHGLALLMLVVLWLGYSPLMSLLGRGSLNDQLDVVRRRWLSLLIDRSNRTYDAVLLGHVINSVAFFGSATLLVIAGMLGLIASLSSVHELVSQLPFVVKSSIGLFALNLLVVTFILTTGFFSFTYALRKLVYTIALIGAIGEPGQAKSGNEETHADLAATVLTEAVKTFNFGIRSYYYAAAAILLIVSPFACMLATTAVAAMFVWRQTATRTAAAIGQCVDTLTEDTHNKS